MTPVHALFSMVAYLQGEPGVLLKSSLISRLHELYVNHEDILLDLEMTSLTWGVHSIWSSISVVLNRYVYLIHIM